MRILFADDDDEYRQRVVAALESVGHVVVAVASGNAFLSWLDYDEESFEAFVTDHDMPGMTGLDVIRILRADERYRHVPIILHSGSLSVSREALALGAAYVHKANAYGALIAALKLF